MEEIIESFIEAIVSRPFDAAAVESYQDHILDRKCQTKQVSNAIISAFSRIYSRRSIVHLALFMEKCIAQSQDFSNVFATMLISRAESIAKSFSSERFIALKLSCEFLTLFMNANMDLDTVSWISPFLIAQAMVLEAAVDDKKRHQSQVAVKFRCLLTAHPSLVPKYVDVIRNAGKERHYYALWLVLCQHVKKEDHHDTLFQAYVAWTFDTKNRAFIAFSSNDPRFQSLSIAQFESLIKPTLSKLLKKSPDTVLESVSSFVNAAPLDFGPYLSELFISVITNKLRSQTETVRECCVQLTSNLMQSLRQNEHQKLLFSEIGNVLDGKHGLLAHFYQRESVYLALLGSFKAYQGILEGKEAVYDTLVPILLRSVQKEAHEVTRMRGMEALGTILCYKKSIGAAMEQIQKALRQSSEQVRAGYLYALGTFLYRTEKIQSAVMSCRLLVKDCLSIVSEYVKKPKSAPLSRILAIGILASLSCMDSGIAAETKEHRIFDYIIASEELCSSITRSLFRVSRDAWTDMVMMAQNLLISTVWHILSRNSGDLVPAHVYALFIELLCSSDRSVRVKAQAHVQKLYAQSQTHSVFLLQAFIRYLVASEENNCSSGVLRNVLRTIVPAQPMEKEIQSQLFAYALFASHHPLLIGGKRLKAFGKEWKSLRIRFSHAEKDSKCYSEDVSDQIDEFVGSDEGIQQCIVDILIPKDNECEFGGYLFSDSVSDRIAAQRVLVSLLEFSGTGEAESLALNTVIQKRLCTFIRLKSMSEYEIAVYQTPFDKLYKEEKEVKTESTRGSGRRIGTEDEEWERQVQLELEAKKAQALKETYTLEQLDLLNNQQSIRRRFQTIEENIRKAISTVKYLSQTCPDELHPAIPYLLFSATELIKSDLFSALGNAMILALAKCISPAILRLHSEAFANCYRLVFASKKLISAKDMEDFYYQTIAVLMDYSFGYRFVSEKDYDAESPANRLPPPSLHLIFPILKASMASAQHYALPLFALHARMIPEEEEEEVGDAAAQCLLRKDMICLTLELLILIHSEQTTIQNADLHPSKILNNLCAGPALALSEWEFILGDNGLLSTIPSARLACLHAIHTNSVGEGKEQLQSDAKLASRLFVATFDEYSEAQELARLIWKECDLAVLEDFSSLLLELLSHKDTHVRERVAIAIAHAIQSFPEMQNSILNRLQQMYQSNIPRALSLLDEFGIPKARTNVDASFQEDSETSSTRCGVGICIEKAFLTNTFSQKDIHSTIAFIIDKGLTDPNGSVRSHMRKAGIQVIDSCGGGTNTLPLLSYFEDLLETKQNDADSEKFDHQREGIVVFLGALAKHLDKTDPKVGSIVDSLLEALKIPSESIQRSVSLCLSPLIPAVKEKSHFILDSLLARGTMASRYGERMGAAYGISAVIKGLGVSSLKQHSIIPRLEESIKNGGADARQGAMFVFECLSERLGMLFEPYIIVILPIMLKCSADTNVDVRESASQASKKIMSKLSAPGVKLVLPSLLKTLEDGAWRTKQAGIFILGSMAHCAPRQLGSCLPQVVPMLMRALTDSHPKVREAAKSALRDIGSVVRNPEIASNLKGILNALEDPNTYATDALQQLQSTAFKHSIDAPSLALVMPIITRGLKDRGGEAKKKSALIIGSICKMTSNAKDLIPYMELVLPSLKAQLMDPIPEVRTISAKALGKLVTGLGEGHFTDIIGWLLDSVKGDCGSVERSGAAQGLCEVLVALGMSRVETTLFDDILPLARHPKSSVREGVLWIIAFLPPVLGKAFAIFLQDALPIILTGLSDESEAVRDVAAHAGHVVVGTHAASNAKDILPSLEKGLFDDDWRIRQSSVTLLGDLMHRISGIRNDVSTKIDDEDVDAAGSAAGDRAIIKLLGLENRNALLAYVYMIRSDASAVVRQSALQVWKNIVVNTPKTLRQIMQTLMDVIVKSLAGENREKQIMAARTLGEIVRKLGESILQQIIPILRSGMMDTQSTAMRRGACVGLTEVIESCLKKQIEEYIDTLVAAIVDGLCDALAELRNTAAVAFVVLHKQVGFRAIDETIPCLLMKIKSASPESDEQSRARLGLQDLLRLKSREIMPYIIPRLLAKPLTANAVQNLAHVAQASGSVIHFQVEGIFAVLFEQYVREDIDASLREDIQQTLCAIMLSVDECGVHWLAIEICKYCGHDSSQTRALAFHMIETFCASTKTDYQEQIALLLKQIIQHLNDANEAVLMASSKAFVAMNKTVRPEALVSWLDFIRQSINSMVSDARHRKGRLGADGEYLLPGLCIPKGLEPFLPSYQYALMNGTPELRQSAADGLGELVQLSSTESLRPYVIKLTGPLIRIAGDRFPSHVKAAVIQTLEILMRKSGIALKPFLPQLQTTFIKAINDTSFQVREHGSSALSNLVTLNPRIDPLVAELTEKLKTTTGSIRAANMEALLRITDAAEDKISPAVKLTMHRALVDLLETHNENLHCQASQCLALSLQSKSKISLQEQCPFALPSEHLTTYSTEMKQSIAIFWNTVFTKQLTWASAHIPSAVQVLSVLSSDEHVLVRSASIEAISSLIKFDQSLIHQFISIISSAVTDSSPDVCRIALQLLKKTAKEAPHLTRSNSQLIQSIFELIRSNNMAVKIPAERALLYLLEIHTRPETMTEYLKQCEDAANGKLISEYARRVLSKLKCNAEDSE